MTKKIIFDSNHFASNFKISIENYRTIEEICKYCGVCWETRVIKTSAYELGTLLSQNQITALSTFQLNLVQFFEHFDKFLNIKTTEFKSKTFINNLKKDFEKRAMAVFQSMTQNFIENLLLESVSDPKSNDNLIENLCSGDLEKTLKLVPSRDLARQLGISDQKLRREIYLARQRALKKRPIPKYYLEKVPNNSSDDGGSPPDEFKNVDESKFEGYFNLEVPTCASPISTLSSNDNCDIENFADDDNDDNDGDVVMECSDKQEQEPEVVVIDEWSIESLLRSELYES